MMRSGNEISALLRLMDDPDDEIYDTVATKLLHYGKEIIPKLEQLWEITADESLQQRIESLIHRVHFENLQKDFLDWCNTEQPDLLMGAILIARYQFPELNSQNIENHFEQIRRNVWLELNNYLSPVEQVNIFNSILYSYYKLQGHELTERDPKYFFINQVLESRQGNSYTIGIIYLALCEALDVPIFAFNIPRQFIFGYVDTMLNIFNFNTDDMREAAFFVDPINGIIYTRQDVDTYLKKINAKERTQYFAPLLNKQVIYNMMEELCLCYKYRKEDHKAEEVQQLMNLLKEKGE